MRYGDQHAIRPPPLGLGLNCGYKLTICWVKGLYRAKGQALSAALGDGIAGVEVRGLQLANHEKLQADGAAADYENGFTWRDARLLHGFDDGVDRLDEGSFFERDIVRKRDDAALCDPGHGFDVFAEAAAVLRDAAGAAGALVLLTLREEALLAVEAFGAGRVVEAHYAVAGFPFGDTGAHGDDRAGEFVAEDLRRHHATLKNFLDVGVADAARGDFFQSLRAVDFADGNFFDVRNFLLP